MKAPDHAFRVGAVLILLTVLLFALVFSLNGVRTWWHGSERLTVIFRDVQGICTDDPVRFHGVPCGRVADVRFVGGGATTGQDGRNVAHAATLPDDGTVEIHVDVEIPSEVRGFLRDGSRVSIDKTLTGVTVIELAQGDGEPLGAGQSLTGTENVTLTQVTEELNGAAVQVNAILESLRVIIDGAREQNLVNGTLASLRGTSDELRSLITLVEEIAAENREPVHRVLDETATLAAGLNETVVELPAVMNDVHGTVRTIGALAGQLESWFSGARADLSVTTEEVASAATHLNALSAELRRRPWRLLHSPSTEEALALDLSDSVEHYARGAVELRRMLDGMQQLLARHGDDPALGPELTKLLGEIEARLLQQRGFEDGFFQRLKQIQGE